MAIKFADQVRARLRTLLERHGMKPGSRAIAERMGRPHTHLHKRLREPPESVMTLDEVDEVLEALAEPPEAVFRKPRVRTPTESA